MPLDGEVLDTCGTGGMVLHTAPAVQQAPGFYDTRVAWGPAATVSVRGGSYRLCWCDAGLSTNGTNSSATPHGSPKRVCHS